MTGQYSRYDPHARAVALLAKLGVRDAINDQHVAAFRELSAAYQAGRHDERLIQEQERER